MNQGASLRRIGALVLRHFPVPQIVAADISLLLLPTVFDGMWAFITIYLAPNKQRAVRRAGGS